MHHCFFSTFSSSLLAFFHRVVARCGPVPALGFVDFPHRTKSVFFFSPFRGPAGVFSPLPKLSLFLADHIHAGLRFKLAVLMFQGGFGVSVPCANPLLLNRRCSWYVCPSGKSVFFSNPSCQCSLIECSFSIPPPQVYVDKVVDRCQPVFIFHFLLFSLWGFFSILFFFLALRRPFFLFSPGADAFIKLLAWLPRCLTLFAPTYPHPFFLCCEFSSDRGVVSVGHFFLV